LTLGAVLMVGFCSPASGQSAGPSVPNYGVFEQSFSWGNSGNVTINVTFKAPSGKQATAGGFYDGSNVWKGRFAPTEVGAWTWSGTLSDGGASQNYSGSFNSVASSSHGFLRSNPNNRFRWVFDDGTPFYARGFQGAAGPGGATIDGGWDPTGDTYFSNLS